MSTNPKFWKVIERLDRNIQALTDSLRTLEKQSKRTTESIHNLDIKLDILGNQQFLKDSLKEQIEKIDAELGLLKKVQE